MTRATLLEQGLVVDGSGEPARADDVLLQGDRWTVPARPCTSPRPSSRR